MRILSTRLSAAILFILFVASLLMLSCESTNPVTSEPDCSRLDYWTTDGQGGCIQFTHSYSRALGNVSQQPKLFRALELRPAVNWPQDLITDFTRRRPRCSRINKIAIPIN